MTSVIPGASQGDKGSGGTRRSQRRRKKGRRKREKRKKEERKEKKREEKKSVCGGEAECLIIKARPLKIKATLAGRGKRCKRTRIIIKSL
jgi:hypothetical protein